MMNRNRMIVVCMVVALGGLRAAKANPLQIQEARQELAHTLRCLDEAKRTLEKDKLAYKALREAAKEQEAALALSIRADKAKQLAQRNSVNAVENGRTAQPYLADDNHSYGEAKIIGVQGS